MHVSLFMIFALTVSYIIKGMCGFANTLVFTSIVTFRESSVNITPIDLLIGFPANIIMVVQNRRDVHLKTWLPLASLALLGDIPGIFFLKTGDVRNLKVLLGFVIIGISLEMLVRETRTSTKKTSKPFLLILGLTAGFITGLFGIGALMAACLSRVTDSSKEFRGNLCAVFIVDNTFRLIAYIMTGIITKDILRASATLFPFMLLGLGLGMLFANRINEHLMKKIIIFLLIISGTALILTNLR